MNVSVPNASVVVGEKPQPPRARPSDRMRSGGSEAQLPSLNDADDTEGFPVPSRTPSYLPLSLQSYRMNCCPSNPGISSSSIFVRQILRRTDVTFPTLPLSPQFHTFSPKSRMMRVKRCHSSFLNRTRPNFGCCRKSQGAGDRRGGGECAPPEAHQAPHPRRHAHRGSA